MPGIFGLTKKTDNQGGTPIELSLLNIHTDELYHRRKDYSNDRISNSIVLFDFMQDYQFHYQTNTLVSLEMKQIFCEVILLLKYSVANILFLP